MGGKLFFGGVPTGPDVKILMEAFGKPEVGKIMHYDEVSRLIKCDRVAQRSRFLSVTNQWRKDIEELYDIIIGVDPGVGFVALSDPKRLDSGVSTFKAARRRVRRAQRLVCGCDDSNLTEDERIVRNSVNQACGKMAVAGLMDRRRALSDGK